MKGSAHLCLPPASCSAPPSPSASWIGKEGYRREEKMWREENARLEHWRVRGAKAGIASGKGAAFDMLSKLTGCFGPALFSRAHEGKLSRCTPV